MITNFNFFGAPTAGPKPVKPAVFSVPSSKKVEEPKVEEETKAEKISSEQTVAEEVVEKAIDVEEEMPQETPSVVEEVPVASSEEATTPEETPAPKKRTRRSKITTEDAAKSEDTEEATHEIINASYNPDKIKLAAIQKTFTPEMDDEEWEKTKADLERRVANIKVTEDLNLGAVRTLLAQTTNVYSDLKRESRTNKTVYSVLTDKAIGLITRQQQINAEGKNNEERKKNSYLSCEHFKMKSEKTEYNLYDIAMILQDRVDTINDLLDDVKQKKESLISFLAVLKLEAGMK